MTEFQKTIKYVAFALAILLIAGIFYGGFMGFAALVGELSGSDDSVQTTDENGNTVKTFNQNAEKLEIEVNTNRISIVKGDTLSVSYDKSDVKVKSKKNTLKIEEKGVSLLTKDSSVITVTVPEDYSFSEVEIEAGAAKTEIEYLLCKKLSVDFGAGELTGKNITVTDKAKFEVGAGKLTLTDSVLHDLTVESGAGSSSIGALLTGKAQIESGVGSNELLLEGSKEDYAINIETNGVVIVGDETTANDYTCGDGENTVNIEGGVGKVVVKFSDEEQETTE